MISKSQIILKTALSSQQKKFVKYLYLKQYNSSKPTYSIDIVSYADRKPTAVFIRLNRSEFDWLANVLLYSNYSKRLQHKILSDDKQRKLFVNVK